MQKINIATNTQTAIARKYVKLTLLVEFSSHEFISHVEPESPSHIDIKANTQNALYFIFVCLFVCFLCVCVFLQIFERWDVLGGWQLLFVYKLTMILNKDFNCFLSARGLSNKHSKNIRFFFIIFDNDRERKKGFSSILPLIRIYISDSDIKVASTFSINKLWIATFFCSNRLIARVKRIKIDFIYSKSEVFFPHYWKPW